MGFISDIESEEKASIAFYSKTNTVTSGIVQPATWTLVATVEGLMWFSAKSLSYVSDRLKTNVDGAVSIDYVASIAAMKDNSRLVVDSKNYEILHIENVGRQNEVLEIFFKREASN